MSSNVKVIQNLVKNVFNMSTLKETGPALRGEEDLRPLLG